MTYKAKILVDDLRQVLVDLRKDGFLARQSSEEPDVVYVYGKDKDALVEVARKHYKQRGLENITFDDSFYEGLVEDEKVDDAELMAAVQEPEHVEKEFNKTEADLYLERHPLDLHGKKHPANDEELLKAVKAGKDFKVDLKDAKEDDVAVKVTEAQPQRGGSDTVKSGTEADKAEKDKEGAKVVTGSVDAATQNEKATPSK